jgi:GT2 family glycosyltransferase
MYYPIMHREGTPIVTHLIPSFHNAPLLESCLPSLIRSITIPSQIIVILNEYDHESVDICKQHNVEFLAVSYNYGTAAIDLAIPLTRGKYITNVNTDMLFSLGWDTKLLNTLLAYHPCSTSGMLVENSSTSPFFQLLQPGFDLETDKNFFDFVYYGQDTGQSNNVPKCNHIGYNHPIMVTREDFHQVKGYSNNFHREWMQIDFQRGLDVDFACRLSKLYDGKFKLIVVRDAFIYHAGSLTIRNMPRSGDPSQLLKKLHGMDMYEFHDKIRFWKALVGSAKH